MVPKVKRWIFYRRASDFLSDLKTTWIAATESKMSLKSYRLFNSIYIVSSVVKLMTWRMTIKHFIEPASWSQFVWRQHRRVQSWDHAKPIFLLIPDPMLGAAALVVQGGGNLCVVAGSCHEIWLQTPRLVRILVMVRTPALWQWPDHQGRGTSRRVTT